VYASSRLGFICEAWHEVDPGAIPPKNGVIQGGADIETIEISEPSVKKSRDTLLCPGQITAIAL